MDERRSGCDFRDEQIVDWEIIERLGSSTVTFDYDDCDTDHLSSRKLNLTPDQQHEITISHPRARYSMPLESLPTRTEVY